MDEGTPARPSSVVPSPSSEDLVPLAPLARYLAEQGLVGAEAQLAGARRVGLGQSNLTFILQLADGGEVVLRRPPPGPLPPSAYDVLREYRVMTGLERSSVPIAGP